MDAWQYHDVFKLVNKAQDYLKCTDSEEAQEVKILLENVLSNVQRIRSENNPWAIDRIIEAFDNNIPEGLELSCSRKTVCDIKIDLQKWRDWGEDSYHHLKEFLRYLKEERYKYYSITQADVLRRYNNNDGYYYIVSIKIKLKEKTIIKNPIGAMEAIRELYEKSHSL